MQAGKSRPGAASLLRLQVPVAKRTSWYRKATHSMLAALRCLSPASLPAVWAESSRGTGAYHVSRASTGWLSGTQGVFTVALPLSKCMIQGNFITSPRLRWEGFVYTRGLTCSESSGRIPVLGMLMMMWNEPVRDDNDLFHNLEFFPGVIMFRCPEDLI